MPDKRPTYSQLMYERKRAKLIDGDSTSRVHKDPRDRAESDKNYYAKRRDVDPISNAIWNSGRWRRLSKMVRAEEPLCCDPFKRHKKRGRFVSSTETHHIIAIKDDPSKALKRFNLVGICRTCHNTITRMENRGTSTRYLFMEQLARRDKNMKFH